MKKTLLSILMLLPLMLGAQVNYGNLPPLHVEGNLVKDVHGNTVKLRGVSDSPSPSLNGEYWGEECTTSTATKAVSYFSKIFAAINKPSSGTNCNVFRLQMEADWVSDPSAEGVEKYKSFSASKMKTFADKLYWKAIMTAMKRGLYVVVSAPNDCPASVTAGDDYQQYLLNMWDAFTQNDSIRKYSGQISIELMAAPAQVKAAAGGSDDSALADFLQPVVDKIRSNHFTGILWAPGIKGQDFRTYAQHPIKGVGIGYSVNNAQGDFLETNPVLFNNVEWSAQTAAVLKGLLDSYPCLGMTLNNTAAYIDLNELIENGNVLPANGGDAQGSGSTCFSWYAEMSEQYPTFQALTRYYSGDQGNGTYINPVVNADFPDIDVVRVGDVYYMVTTTMFVFPGATILKSYDLVNWEYCANPLQQIADNDGYNLLNGQDFYSRGQWASSIKYHNGKFYIHFIAFGDGGGGFLLTATDPEGKWTIKKVDGYYDNGVLFDDGPNGDGKCYIAYGIDEIRVSEIDPNTWKAKKTELVVKDNHGLEGCHMYHIGDYYYIYATRNNFANQTIFRSKSPFGPYEEKDNVFNHKRIHQGALVETQTGEWWTLIFQDAGAVGRVPFLQPVKWVDGWPVIGNNGKDVSDGGKAYRKPDVGTTYPRTYLPTNDSFTSLTLGKQWGWNHNPDNSAWSLLENPGHLRLHTTGIADRLDRARNSLTQRTIRLNHEGSSKNLNTYGTVKLDVSGMSEGDVAGLSVFSDPYSLIGVTMRDGQKRLYYMQSESDANGGTAAKEKVGAVIKSDTIYLRAILNFSSNSCDYYYSYDNSKFAKFGDGMSLRYTLKYFIGTRFFLFNYATKQKGGYVDFDWFSTEPNFSEDLFFGEEIMHAYPAEEVTVTSLKASANVVSMMPGCFANVKLTCTMQSGNNVDVTTGCNYTFSTPGILTTKSGRLVGVNQGTTEVTATYTDLVGNQLSTTFQATVSYFPLDEDMFNPALIGNGTVTVRANYAQIKLVKNGLAGWHYEQGLDLSDKGRYLVVCLNRTLGNTKPTIRIYDENDLTSTNYYTSPTFGSDSINVIDLQEAAKQVDLSHVYYLGFAFPSTVTTLQVTSVYLTDDPTDNTPIQAVSEESPAQLLRVEFYSADGKRQNGLQPGVNIVRRVFNDGRTDAAKVIK